MSISVAVCHVSVVNWRQGWGQSVMNIRQCNGLPDIHAQLTPYLDTSSENMNSFPHFRFGSQCALHLSTSSEIEGAISDSLSEHFI